MSGTLTLGGNNNVNGKLVILNAAGQPIAESDWMGISFYSGMSQADKSVYYRIARNGFVVRAGNNENNVAGVLVIDGEYDSATNIANGNISLNAFNTATNVISPMIQIDGSNGRIDCKSLYINGVQVTP
jgi:hypothetical protein